MAQYLPLPDGSFVTVREGEAPADAWERAQREYPEAFGITPQQEAAPVEQPRTLGGYAKETLKAIPAGAVNMLESAAVGASALLPDQIEPAARAGIKSVADAAKAPFTPDAAYADTLPVKIGAGVGSTLPFLAAGPFGLAGRIGATALGMGAGAGEARTRAEEEGATAEQIGQATGLGALVGATEVIAPFRILNRIPTASKAQGVALVKRALAAGGEEAAQEAAASWAQNLIAQQIYKPEQELIEGLGEAATVGGATGALIQGILDLATGGGRRAAKAPPPAPQEETEEEAPPPPPAPPTPQQIYNQLEALRGRDLNDQEGQIVDLQEQMQEAAAAQDFERLEALSTQIIDLKKQAKDLEKQLPKGFVPESKAESRIDKLLKALQKATDEGNAEGVKRITAELRALDAPQRLAERAERAQRDEDMRAQTVGAPTEEDPYLSALEDQEQTYDTQEALQEFMQREADLQQQQQTVGAPAETDPFVAATEEANAAAEDAYTSERASVFSSAIEQPRLFPEEGGQRRVNEGEGVLRRSPAMVQAEMQIVAAAAGGRNLQSNTRFNELREELAALRSQRRATEQDAKTAQTDASTLSDRSLEQALGMRLPPAVAQRQAATDARYRAFGQITSLLERVNAGRAKKEDVNAAKKQLMDAIEAEIRLINPDADRSIVQEAQREARELLNDLQQRWGDTRDEVNVGTLDEPAMEPVQFGRRFRNDLNDPGPTGFGLANVESRAPGSQTFNDRFAAAESTMGGLDGIVRRATGSIEQRPGVDRAVDVPPAEALSQALGRIEQDTAQMRDPEIAAVVQRLRQMERTLALNPVAANDALSYLRDMQAGRGEGTTEQRRIGERQALEQQAAQSDEVVQEDMFPDTQVQGRIFNSFEEFDQFLASPAVDAVRRLLGATTENLSRVMQRAAPLQARAAELEKRALEIGARTAAIRKSAEENVEQTTRQLEEEQADLTRLEERLAREIAAYELNLTKAQQALREALEQKAQLSADLNANMKRILGAANAGVRRARGAGAAQDRADELARSRVEQAKQVLQDLTEMRTRAETNASADYAALMNGGNFLATFDARQDQIQYITQQMAKAHNDLVQALRGTGAPKETTDRLDGFSAFVIQQQALQKQLRSVTGRVGALTAIRNRAQEARDAAQGFLQVWPGNQQDLDNLRQRVGVARSLQKSAEKQLEALNVPKGPLADSNAEQTKLNSEAQALRREVDEAIKRARAGRVVPDPVPTEAQNKKPVEPDAGGKKRIEEQKRLEQREFPTAGDGTPLSRAIIDFKVLRDKLDAYQEAPERIQELLTIINNPMLTLAARVQAASELRPADIKRFSDLSIGQYLDGSAINAPLFKDVDFVGPLPQEQISREDAAAELEARKKAVEDKIAARSKRIEMLVEAQMKRILEVRDLAAQRRSLDPRSLLTKKEQAKVATATKRSKEEGDALAAQLAERHVQREDAALNKKIDALEKELAGIGEQLLKATGATRTPLPSRAEAKRQREELLRSPKRELTQEEKDAIAEKRRLRSEGKSTNLGAAPEVEAVADAAISQTTRRTTSPATRETTQRGGLRTGETTTQAQRKGAQTARIVESQRPKERDLAISEQEMRDANRIAADIEAAFEAAQIAAAQKAKKEALKQAKLDKTEKQKQAAEAEKQAKAEAKAKRERKKISEAKAKTRATQKALENDDPYDGEFDSLDPIDGIDKPFNGKVDTGSETRAPEPQQGPFDPVDYLEQQGTAVDEKAPFNGMTFAQAARWGAENAKNPLQRFLFNRLAEVLDVVPSGTTAGRVFAIQAPMLRWEGEKLASATGGRYLSKPNVVFSRSYGGAKSQSSINTLMHELAHAATSRALMQSQQLFTKVNKLKRQARAWLDTDAGKQYLKDNPGLTAVAGKVYGTTNPHEFVAELYGNPEFQAMLARIPASTPGRSVLSRFVKAVANYFGLDTKGQQTVLAQAMALSEDIFEYTKREIYKDGNTQAYLDVAFNAPSAQYSPDMPEDLRSRLDRTVGGNKTWLDRLSANVSGLAFRTQFLDRLAPVEELIRQGVAKGMISSTRAFQASYFLRFGEQRNQLTQTAALMGVPQLRKTEDGDMIIEKPPGERVNIRAIGEVLAEANAGNEQATEKVFTQWLAVLRAESPGVGYDKLNMKDPLTPAEAKKIKDYVAADPTRKAAFEKARKMYRQYNNDLLDLMQQTGALTKEEVAKFKQGDYVPYYRERNGVVDLIVAGEKPIRIGDIASQPDLQELVGGEEAILPFFSGAMQNTQMLINMALRNQQTKDVAFLLNELGAVHRRGRGDKKAPPFLPGTGPAVKNKIQFKIDGALHYAVVEDAFGVPADLLVQGLQGIKTTIPAVFRLLQIPADILRTFITRAPAYAIRQIVREPINAFLVSGANFVPIVSSVGELAKVVTGRSEAANKLEASGAISSNVITGDIQDQARILRDLSQDKNAWTKLMSAADRFAIQGDTATRAVLYDKFRKQGMTHMQATLGTLEVMNFGRRGLSPTMQIMSMLVPFFNAQVQGMDVIYRSMTGKSTFEDKMDVQRKLYTRGALVAAATVAYALAMQDDEAYKNATPQERALNWFLRVPGLEQPLRVPIPFELGYLFKALPELMINTAYGDTEAKEALKTIGSLAYNTVPIGMPQAIKPMVEVMTNYSFFTGSAVEGQRERLVNVEERFRDNTTEFSKMLGGAGVLSPIQLDYLIRGYTGGLGITLLSLSNFAVRPFNGEELPQGPTKTLNQMPFLGPLFQPNDGRRAIDEAFGELEKWQQAQQTFKRMLEQGRRSEALAFSQKYSRDIALATTGGAFRQQMGELAAVRRAVIADPNFTPEQKRVRVDQIRQIEIALARRVRELGQAGE